MAEQKSSGSAHPGWADWNTSDPYTVGIEEEVMLIDPADFSLAHRIEEVLPRLSPDLAGRVTPETHGSAIELNTTPHPAACEAAREAASLRATLEAELARLGLCGASAGTHPFALWTETEVSKGARYQLVYGSMRELARREPTFAVHVQIGVAEPEAAILLHNRLRAHLPLLLAISANSPFWQGRDAGFASSRTPLFQAFPRVGIPRAFADYEDYVETVDQLLRCGAFPEPTFLWWDVRPQARLGTVEVRIMDAQTSPADTYALAALVQAVAHLELEEGYAPEELIRAPEVLSENRFLAARDGMDARLLDPLAERRIPVREMLAALLQAARPHAAAIGCEDALDQVFALMREPGAARQRRIAGDGERLAHLVGTLADTFTSPIDARRVTLEWQTRRGFGPLAKDRAPAGG